MAAAEIVFAFDARIDQPPCPIDMPSDRRQRFAKAALTATLSVFSEAEARKAQGLVLFGDVLDPRRVSPAQAADIAEAIEAFTADGRVVVVTEANVEAAAELAIALGDPPGLQLLTPQQPVVLHRGSLSVELACNDPRDVVVTTILAPAPDSAASSEPSETSPGATARPRVIARGIVSGRSHACGDPHPAADPHETIWSLPSLQPRSRHEHGPGVAASLEVSSEGRITDWSVFPTAVVSWQDVRTVCSATEQEEELSATAAVEMEQAVGTCPTPLVIMRLLVNCEGSAERRGRVSRMAHAVLAEMRQLLETTPGAGDTLAWCEQVEADPTESLDPLAEADDIGGSRRFPAMLAEEAATWPLDASGDERIPPTDVVREAAWMTLELLEDD